MPGGGTVYLVLAGFSPYAVWRGGEAKGTADALAQLEATLRGEAVLFAIFLGMVAYAVRRIVDAP